jgi:hypothetical protein
MTRVRAIQFLGPFTRLGVAISEGDFDLECDVAASAFAELDVQEGGELPLMLQVECLRMFPAVPAPA